MPNASSEVAGIIVSRYDSLCASKATWNNVWQQCIDYVLPRRQLTDTAAIGQMIGTKIFDSTAPWALEQLASGLHSFLTSPTQRWMRLRLPDELSNTDLADSEEVNVWLQDTTEQIYSIFNSQKTKFNSQAHELYLDIGALGTSVMYVEETFKDVPMRFCTYNLGECVVGENQWGVVDTLYRKFKLERRQAVAKWGDKLPKSFLEKAVKEPYVKEEFLHAVMPREDYDPKMPGPINMPFGSFYIYPSEKIVLAESGYEEFPFMVPRWSKITGEIYGRSPAMTAMPDILMTNAMAKTVIQAAQKVVDPPLQLPDEGFLLPIKTSPGSLNFFNSGMDPNYRITPIDTHGRVDIGLDLIESRRSHIVRAFYVDWMQLQEGPQMTATEVMQRTEEKMRLMAPAIARLQSEFLDPLIERVFAILQRKGLLRPPPDSIRGINLKVEYVSPVAKAQRMTQVTALQRLMETTLPLAQVKPEILDRFDVDGIIDFSADVMDVAHQVLTPMKQVQAIRQQRAQAQAQAEETARTQSQAQTLETVTKADLNSRGSSQTRP